METAIVWGVMLVASIRGMPPITDVNYSTMDECEAVRSQFAAQYPNYESYCIQTWKPDTPHKRTRVVHHHRPTRHASR